MIRPAVLAAVLSFALVLPSDAHAAHRPSSRVRILDIAGNVRSAFSVATANQAGGFTVAIADLGTDGKPEIILGSGLGNAPEVLVLRQDGSRIGRFLAYAANAGMGINVAACDVDGDGSADIVTAPQRGGGPHIRAFDRLGNLKANFFAFDATDRSGVNLACGDVDADGKDEIVTLPAAGAEPLVRVWDVTASGAVMAQEFLALEPGDLRGVVGTVVDGRLVVSNAHASEVTVRTIAFASPATLIESTTMDLDVTGISGILTRDGKTALTSASDGKILDASGAEIMTVTGSPFGAVNAAAADLDGDGIEEWIVADGKPAFTDDDAAKTIVVDLSDQRLYAYEHGVLANTFLVSTAAKGWRTPVGKHSVLAKVPSVRYAGRGYDLGTMPYNLRIIPHIYIHPATWHSNFGHPMSHGCVNVALENAKWVYEWAAQGIPVEVRT